MSKKKTKEDEVPVASTPQAPIKLPPREGTLNAILQGATPPEPETIDKDHEIVAANDAEADILRDAIPASVVEKVLSKGTRKQAGQAASQASTPVGVLLPAKDKRHIVRGDVLLHKPTGRNVTVVKPDVGVSSKGFIKHRVMTRGISKKFEVPENHLEDLP